MSIVSPPNPTCNPAAWAARAPELAAWADGLLVNRRDAWGGYLPLALRVNGDDKSRTKPARHLRGQVFLDRAVLTRHFAGRDVGYVAGLHSTSPENTSRWGGVDIDHHGPDSSPPEANRAAALAWYGRLRDLGFVPLLTDSNGKGGFHLLALFAEPVPTATVYAFLRWLVKDYAAHGLTEVPETFPKQACVKPGRFGNWLRLPGRHHTEPHWSRVWDGAGWLNGAEAVAYLLTLRSDKLAVIPAEARTFCDRPTSTARTYRRPACAPTGDGLARRIMAYMRRLPTGLGVKQHRDDIAYSFGAWLTRDMGLTDEAAISWLVQWDRGNSPPKGEDCLRAILANVHLYATHAVGSGLGRPGEDHPVTVYRYRGAL
jgi:putative DNA primase/helicase